MNTGAGRIEKFNSSLVWTAGAGTLGTGNGQFSTSAKDIQVDNTSANLYVADPGNHRVQRFNMSLATRPSSAATAPATGSSTTPTASP